MSDDDKPSARHKPLQPRNGKPRVNAPGPDTITKADFEQRRVVKPSQPSVRLRPHIGKLLADSYNLIALELDMLYRKAARGEELDKEESRKLQGYVDSIAKLAREEREQEKRNDPAGHSTEELVELLPKVAKVLDIPVEKLLDKGSDEE